MFINILKLSLIVIITLFLFIVYNHYFSEQNLKLIKKNRNETQNESYKKVLDLPILGNNTNNIIEFNTGFKDPNNKNFKRNFWELFN